VGNANYNIAFDVNGDGAINNLDKLRFNQNFSRLVSW
jgi:hypothetical protein